MRIFIRFFNRGFRKEIKLDVPENITIKELRRRLPDHGGHLIYDGEEIFDGRLSDYDIQDGDEIIVDDYQQHDTFLEQNREIKNESTHICPYGCGRQVPNEFKGCTELLQAKPNYYG